MAYTILLHNGYIEDDPEGQPFTFQGVDLWFWGVEREGISVDGSYEYTLSNNIFMDNSNRGVLLYKNCGDYPGAAADFTRSS